LFISSRLPVPSGGAVVLAMSAVFFVTLALGVVTKAVVHGSRPERPGNRGI
jgi:hypothetical protein